MNRLLLLPFESRYHSQWHNVNKHNVRNEGVLRAMTSVGWRRFESNTTAENESFFSLSVCVQYLGDFWIAVLALK